MLFIHFIAGWRLLESFEYGNMPLAVKDGFKFKINNKGEVMGEKTTFNFNDFKKAAARKDVAIKYTIVTEFKNDFAIIRDSRYKYGFIDTNYNVIVIPLYKMQFFFRHDLAVVNLDNKYGIINGKGQLILPVIYDNIDEFTYQENRIPVGINKTFGYADYEGRIVIPLKFQDAWRFDQGTASVKFEGKYGLIDTIGQVVVPFKYNNVIIFFSNAARVQQGGKWGYINRDGKEICPLIYDDVREAKFGMGRGLLYGKWIDIIFSP